MQAQHLQQQQQQQQMLQAQQMQQMQQMQVRIFFYFIHCFVFFEIFFCIIK